MATSERRSDRFSAVDLAEAARRVASRGTSANTLTKVIEMATESGVCDGASVTMLGQGRSLTTVTSSDDLIARADRLQYELHEGPCVDALFTDGLFVVKDLVADGRWPRWAPRAAELGVTGVLSVHLFTDSALGSLNLYSTRAREYGHADIVIAKVIAAHASVALAHEKAQQNLWNAIDSRNVIGQAQGILMERFGLDAERAFSVLRRHSQDHNRKLAVIAEELVRTGKLFGLDDTAAGGEQSSWADERPGRAQVPENAG